MELTRQDVEHLAMLVRVGLTDDEVDTLLSQLSTILGHVNQLSELNTEAISPTAQVVTLVNVSGADEPRPCQSRVEMLANAPQQEEGYFRVKSVLGYET